MAELVDATFTPHFLQRRDAGVVKLVDTQRSGRCNRKVVGVQISPPAKSFLVNDNSLWNERGKGASGSNIVGVP